MQQEETQTRFIPKVKREDYFRREIASLVNERNACTNILQDHNYHDLMPRRYPKSISELRVPG